MKKIYSMLILLMIVIIGITLQIFKIKEISHVESFVIESYLNDLKDDTTNTKYTLSEKYKIHTNDDVIKRFNIAGRRINIEKLSGFLKNADYLYYEVEKRSSITKKIEEYNDKYLKRFVVFYFPSEGEYKRNIATLQLCLGKIDGEWLVLGSLYDIETDINGIPETFIITEPRN